MELRNGFKQTEVGIIPNDWDVVDLFELAGRKKALFDDGDWIESEHITDEGIRLIQTGNIGIGSYVEKNLKKYIYSSSFEILKCKELQIGDLLICRLAEPAGRSCILPKLEDTRIVTSVDVTIFRPLSNKANRRFLNQIFATRRWLENVSENSGGTTHKRISRGRLAKLVIPLPSLIEQDKIASALCDADELSKSLEKIIEKKRNIKHGAMQKLLEPKDDWVVKKLGEVAEIVGGGTPSTLISNYWNGDINWFTPTEIGINKYTYESIRKISKDGLKNCSGRILPKGTILLTTRAGIGDLSILMKEGCTNQGFQSLIVKESYNNEYFYYLLQTLKSVLIQNASGSTFLEISPNKLKQIQVSLPSFSEQYKIAMIISDMDNEINSLEKKLSKLNTIKQGMMQNLLTGKIRLV
jgi:type I restriction enzyme, S subunit